MRKGAARRWSGPSAPWSESCAPRNGPSAPWNEPSAPRNGPPAPWNGSSTPRNEPSAPRNGPPIPGKDTSAPRNQPSEEAYKPSGDVPEPSGEGSRSSAALSGALAERGGSLRDGSESSAALSGPLAEGGGSLREGSESSAALRGPLPERSGFIAEAGGCQRPTRESVAPSVLSAVAGLQGSILLIEGNAAFAEHRHCKCAIRQGASRAISPVLGSGIAWQMSRSNAMMRSRPSLLRCPLWRGCFSAVSR